jgi:hypothetical protein
MANDPLYDLRIERLREEFSQRADEAQQEAENIRTLQEDRRNALQAGDREGAKFFDRECVEAESRYLKLAAELAPPANQLLPQEVEHFAKYQSQWGQPHWSGLTDQTGRKLTNYEIGLMYGHDAAQQYGERGSAANIAALEVLGPVNPDTAIRTGDEALNLVRQSKYGRNLKASDYNKQVRRLAAAKAGGSYRD